MASLGLNKLTLPALSNQVFTKWTYYFAGETKSFSSPPTLQQRRSHSALLPLCSRDEVIQLSSHFAVETKSFSSPPTLQERQSHSALLPLCSRDEVIQLSSQLFYLFQCPSLASGVQTNHHTLKKSMSE